MEFYVPVEFRAGGDDYHYRRRGHHSSHRERDEYERSVRTLVSGVEHPVYIDNGDDYRQPESDREIPPIAILLPRHHRVAACARQPLTVLAYAIFSVISTPPRVLRWCSVVLINISSIHSISPFGVRSHVPARSRTDINGRLRRRAFTISHAASRAYTCGIIILKNIGLSMVFYVHFAAFSTIPGAFCGIIERKKPTESGTRGAEKPVLRIFFSPRSRREYFFAKSANLTVKERICNENTPDRRSEKRTRYT